MAAPWSSKDVPIPRDSDPRKRRAMKAVTAVARSGSSQMESSRAVADGIRMDVKEEKRYEFRSSKAQNSRRRMMTKANGRVTNGRRGKGMRRRDESRSSTEPKTRRRFATKTSLEENKSEESTVAVQEDCEQRRFGDRQQHSKMVQSRRSRE